MPMTPPPARALTACALTLCALLTATACSALSTPPTARKPDYAPVSTPPSPSPAGTPTLTPAQAQAALVRPADLGEPWVPTQGAATWHDGLLKATAERPDCRRLLDTLYTEQLFGADARAGAATGLDDVWNESQLRYQIAAPGPADLDRTLAWLKGLPKKCARFAATTAHGDTRDVEVSAVTLPKVGDARQGLRVTLSGATLNDDPVRLTLDLALVRVGDDAIGLTHGGLGEVSPDVTEAAVGLGTERLTEVRRTGRAEI